MSSYLLHEDAKTILEDWSRWVNSGNEINSLAYPSIQPLFSITHRSKSYVVSEPICLLVDKVLAGVIKQNEHLGVSTALYYLGGFNYSSLSRHLEQNGYNYNRRQVEQFVISGTNAVYASICGEELCA
ncbi:hypothetical protein [Agarilytica rhodophyticola]|uniref:hypothetical protein n=1 Tax=Agarilytica rhodophyticola TaxID=1737490 RepID=UPI000B344C15|nr:hypothetical protein [Agarilytica rhodophyticola]